MMNAEAAAAPFVEKRAQRQCHAAERQRIPRDVGFVEQPDFQ
jgi:hypothetical protein